MFLFAHEYSALAKRSVNVSTEAFLPICWPYLCPYKSIRNIKIMVPYKTRTTGGAVGGVDIVTSALLYLRVEPWHFLT